jgi:hypothetical protein
MVFYIDWNNGLRVQPPVGLMRQDMPTFRCTFAFAAVFGALMWMYFSSLYSSQEERLLGEPVDAALLDQARQDSDENREGSLVG